MTAVNDALVSLFDPANFPTTKQTAADAWEAVLALIGSPDYINVKASPYGATGNGSTDDTAALQAALNALVTRATLYGSKVATLYLPPGTYKVTDTLLLADLLSGAVRGAGKWVTKIVYTGAGSKPVLKLKNCRSCELRGFTVSTSVAVTALIEQQADTTDATLNYGSTYNLYSHLILQGNSTALRGVLIDKAAASVDSGNDFAVFDNVEISNMTTCGVAISQGEAKSNTFQDCTIDSCVIGVLADQSNFQWYRGFMHGNSAADFKAYAPPDPILIHRLQSEGSYRLLDTSTDQSTSLPIIIEGCRWTCNALATDRYVIWAHGGVPGPYVIRGCQFGNRSGTGRPRFGFLGSGHYSVENVGNYFDELSTDADTQVVFGGSDYNLVEYGNNYVNSNGLVTTSKPTTLKGPVSIPSLGSTATGSTTERSLADRFAQVVNVKDFGAAGDGVQDDLTAFNAAYTALLARGGGTIYLPRPSFAYRLSDRWLVGRRFVAEDDIDNSDDLSAQASYSGSEFTAALALPCVNIVAEPGTVVWGDFAAASNAKAVIYYGVCSAERGRISGLTIIGQPGVSGSPPAFQVISGLTAVTGKQVGLCLPGAYAATVEHLKVKELDQGVLAAECYWSHLRDATANHCNNGFALYRANASLAENLACLSCKAYGVIISGGDAHLKQVHGENNLHDFWLLSGDTIEVDGGYLEQTLSDAGVSIVVGDTTDSGLNQVIPAIIRNLRASRLNGDMLLVHNSTLRLKDCRLRSVVSGHGSVLNTATTYVDAEGCDINFEGSNLDKVLERFANGTEDGTYQITRGALQTPTLRGASASTAIPTRAGLKGEFVQAYAPNDGTPWGWYARAAGSPAEWRPLIYVDKVHTIGSGLDVEFENSWATADVNPEFWIDGAGFVNLQANIRHGTGSNNTVAFTLPAGYRPNWNTYCGQVPSTLNPTGAIVADALITPDGKVTVRCNTAADGITLDLAITIRFRAAN